MIEGKESCVAAVEKWVESCVLKLNLCPFAHKPMREGRVRFASVSSRDAEVLWQRFRDELALLDSSPEISNTLLILEERDLDLFDYLDLVAEAEQCLEDWELDGVYQVASFHPQYLFAGEPSTSRSHATNRSPWPIFHILREAEITEALRLYKEPESIPERNKKTLESLSTEAFESFFPRS